LDYSQLVALAQVILIDIVLAGDNAVVVGMAAARVDPRLRAKVIFWGVGGAVVLRIAFAVVATQRSRSSVCYSRAASCCCGCAGRCTATSRWGVYV
jgi:hypothetical protein